jgi:hypothetical protein
MFACARVAHDQQTPIFMMTFVISEFSKSYVKNISLTAYSSPHIFFTKPISGTQNGISKVNDTVEVVAKWQQIVDNIS